VGGGVLLLGCGKILKKSLGYSEVKVGSIAQSWASKGVSGRGKNWTNAMVKKGYSKRRKAALYLEMRKDLVNQQEKRLLPN